MEGKIRKLEGVVIGRKDFFEHDKIITIVTATEGKLRLLAKGVRNLSSHRLGKFELGSRVKILLVKGKNLDLVTEVEVLDSCLTIRKNQTLLGGLIFLCELINELLPENDRNDLVYDQILAVLESLKKGCLNEIVIFESELLNSIGFGVTQEEKKLIDLKDWPGLHLKLKNRIETIIERPLKSLTIFN
ncbi:DNA repair protein RecO [Patescibacteria group bacterium]|nr:DNA repair protein RecO [Patescibacteria group bacterium]